eukprot:1189259-Prorocentrum_minimum.AAC.1
MVPICPGATANCLLAAICSATNFSSSSKFQSSRVTNRATRPNPENAGHQRHVFIFTKIC